MVQQCEENLYCCVCLGKCCAVTTWRAVAEDYAPFDVDVTTIPPSNAISPNNISRVCIGGNGSWYGLGALCIGHAVAAAWSPMQDFSMHIDMACGRGNAMQERHRCYEDPLLSLHLSSLPCACHVL
jgi:hypothetical protein